jgi:hypothetical protein
VQQKKLGAEVSPSIPHVEQELLISRAAEFSPRK